MEKSSRKAKRKIELLHNLLWHKSAISALKWKHQLFSEADISQNSNFLKLKAKRSFSHIAVDLSQWFDAAIELDQADAALERNPELKLRYKQFSELISKALEMLNYPALQNSEGNLEPISSYATMITTTIDLAPDLLEMGFEVDDLTNWPQQLAKIGIASQRLSDTIGKGCDLYASHRAALIGQEIGPDGITFSKPAQKLLLGIAYSFLENFEDLPMLKDEGGEWNVDSPLVAWCKSLIAIALHNVQLHLTSVNSETVSFIEKISEHSNTTLARGLQDARAARNRFLKKQGKKL